MFPPCGRPTTSSQGMYWFIYPLSDRIVTKPKIRLAKREGYTTLLLSARFHADTYISHEEKGGSRHEDQAWCGESIAGKSIRSRSLRVDVGNTPKGEGVVGTGRR